MNQRSMDIARQVTVVVTFIVTLFANYMSTVGGINGIVTGEISDMLPSFFTPDNWAFSVWSVIYTGLIGYVIYHSLPGQRNNPQLRRSGWLFAGTSVVNALWLLAWHYGITTSWLLWASVALMATLLVLLLAIYIRLDIGRPNPTLSWADRLLVHAPFSFYVAWICVATVANVASVANNAGWAGFGLDGPTWAIIMIFVATGIAGAVLFDRANLPFAGVFIWALLAIRSKQGPVEEGIGTAALIAAAIVLIFALIGYYRVYFQRERGTPRLQPSA